MPVKRGHVAPKTTLIETIIRKFDTHSKYFNVNLLFNTCEVFVFKLFVGKNIKINIQLFTHKVRSIFFI